MSGYEEARAAREMRRLGQAAERGVPLKQGRDGAERGQAAVTGLSQGYASSAARTRIERRRASIASAFKPNAAMERLEQMVRKDPLTPVSTGLRLQLGYYVEAREAARKERSR
jgi:hypothetical protein